MQEIFQINQPDLDFGIYRILNSRQNEIQQFLTRTLPNNINGAFNGNFEQANSVYNHLYTFFSRYYDQGDFISQRRYKGDTYAIPYAGEEVMLHWANKDQYYTKSGENFSNYAFTLENGKKVQFRLVEADTAKDNRKDNDQTRVFALIEPRIQTATDENGDEIQTDILPFDIQGDLLTIRFEYKAVNKKEKQADYITQAVEKIKIFAISDEFQDIFKPMPTEKNKTRTLLEKYLTDYTAKNTADYFIHKNLGKFLNQELDFYIKNEVMNLDNIQDSTDFSHIEQNLQTIKTLKTVAKEIIAFLAQLEDFQKKLWLKKKFVAGCHYLITLDHLTEEQVQQALDNPKQTAQWKALFNVETSGQNVAEICKNYPHLVVDTSLFEPKFQAEVLNELHDLDEKTNGLLIHSDNFQALNLLQEKYKEQVKCIYIDPPYNTGEDGFIYKDNYKHSSWNTFIFDRVETGRKLLNEQGVSFVSISDEEQDKLKFLLDDIFQGNYLGTVEWNSTKSVTNTALISVGHTHNYIHAKNLDYFKKNRVHFRLPDSIEGFSNSDNDPRGVWKADPFQVGGERPNQLYEIINPKTGIVYKPNKGNSWKNDYETFQKLLADNRIVFGVSGEAGPQRKRFWTEAEERGKVAKTWWEDVETTTNGTQLLKNLFGEHRFTNPKPVGLISRFLQLGLYKNNQTVLDYFAGSGTTAHAVINLNREDNGNRKYILVEQGEYFDTVLKPRVQKVIFAKEWKDGKPQVDNGAFGGVSQIVKVLKLESYEDTLNNLELRKPAQDLADIGLSETVQNDYLLHYMLDVESRESLLNTQHFTKPFDYQLNIATTSAGAYETKTIDLVETFNYLIGLRVSEINDKRENGLVTVQGTGASGENVLVIWRDCEKYDYDRLNDYLNRHKINPQESEFDVVYINGDHNVPTVFAGNDESVKMLKVRSIEAEFLQRMFE
ncbi:site-specific DNA-methyltransferase [Actinobacillus pleuropneumoniae]|uniref:site-specific DNA-methyltransferase (adenine-specific) n=1 Tax=Actinobacillus pleuropneumoniae TaxID=715 RepID=A0A448TYC7_ACTPL|nr:site-specific DNA-methyltransferase [Actinobacillus pleuropneumoniae]MEE3618016.1 site-specific DNA-methyltransferase [Actinobacillus pleuropneumoniae]UKH08966.1 site-specific DNA-methyltransferase [Actinobacillus pleuropneumoniae]UKH45408.1 site-specific DNA-methyltransferase [Actinobacillus pleuropneumoniae serovar 2 str. S1536]VEJ16658.1 methylation subunit, type III restriction-modification system [Actinobacillus pleuropneumoniae]